ncbi:polyhydroxyalkanoate biosynthesis repressor PhaR [Neobacillus drentensis]|uniref:polyhydroxyalkanoate biosynthesis repressor PhaR n=1 Tax=Neobacillus drentensis TaxID=220684 RepID=UPI002FFE0686
MLNDKTYQPFEGIKRISEMWERQINGLLYMMSDNNEFVNLLKVGTDSHARYLELLRKRQELVAGVMNLPTKKDVAKVAKLSIQAEGKIDILEEQIWNLQDSLIEVNKGNIEMSQEIINIVKKMKDDVKKVEINHANELSAVQLGLKELKQELSQLKDIKSELENLRNLLKEEKNRNNELVLAAAGTTES